MNRYEISLREEILIATHHWHLILLFCLAGSLLGWGLSLLWPSPYRATKELNIGLNVYRAQEDHKAAQLAGLPFINVDDYKNWQMSNLNSLIYTDVILDKTLERLRSADSYWADENREDLAASLHAYWRNAGKWRLVAEHHDPLRAAQAVAAWQDVVVEEANAAIAASRKLPQIDQQQAALIATQAQALARLKELEGLYQTLQAHQQEVASRPANRALEEIDRWLIWQTLVQANLGAAWNPLRDSFPGAAQPARDYLRWLDQASALLEQEIQSVQSQIAALESEQNALAAQYAQASQRSLGLSPNLEVDKITVGPSLAANSPQIASVRPTGTLMLVGGCLGLIVWGFTLLTSISLRSRQ
jgi:hypothetical protein